MKKEPKLKFSGVKLETNNADAYSHSEPQVRAKQEQSTMTGNELEYPNLATAETGEVEFSKKVYRCPFCNAADCIDKHTTKEGATYKCINCNRSMKKSQIIIKSK